MDYRFRSTFTSLARVINPTEDERFVAKASLTELKHLAPSAEEVESNPDLLYIACDGAVGGMVNRNGDAIDLQTAIAIHGTAKHKFISMDHDRDKLVGFVLTPKLTKLGTHEVLTEEQALAANEPVYMSFSGVIWRVIDRMLTKYLVKVGDSIDSDALSMSWEVAFDAYDIGVGAKNTFDAERISKDDVRFAAYNKILRVNEGTGLDRDGKNVFRIINGNPIIVGYSVVPNPAAHVKGILPIDGRPADVAAPAAAGPVQNLPQPDMVKSAAEVEVALKGINSIFGLTNEQLQKFAITLFDTVRKPEIAATSEASLQKSEESSITATKTCVTVSTIPMKIESLDQLGTQWESLIKLDSKASLDSVKNFLADHIAKEAEKFMADKEAKDNIVKTVEASKKESDAKVKDLEDSLANIQKELDTLREQSATTARAAKFNERMGAFDAEFDLTDKEHKIVASKIKTMSDEAFAAYLDECKILMEEKSKAFKAEAAKKKCADDKKAPPFAKDDEDKKKKDDEDEEAEASVKEAIASVIEDASQSKLPNMVHLDKNLFTEMCEAFASSIKVEGRAIKAKK